MGLSDIEFLPGQVTTISGQNGCGKTSIAEGILNVIEGGNCATLIRKGETEGETIIELDDGTVLRKDFTEHRFATSVLIDGTEQPAPSTFIKKLFGTGFNPVKFLMMTKAQRIAEIIKAIPYSITQAELCDLTGYAISGMDYAKHGTIVLEKARESLYQQRTAVNTIGKDANTMSTTLKTSAVTVRDDIQVLVDEAEHFIAQFTEEIRLHQINKIERLLAEEMAEQRETVAIQSKYRDIRDKIHADTAEHKQYITQKITKQEMLLAEYRPELELKAKAENAQGQIEIYQRKARDSDALSRQLSNAIASIDAQKVANASSNTIGGMHVEIDSTNDLLIDGIPFDRLNKAKQVHLAMLLAQKNFGELPLCIVDGAELMDSETQALIEQEAIDNEFQLIMFSVSDEPLNIATKGIITPQISIPQPPQETQPLPINAFVKTPLTGDDRIDYPEAWAQVQAMRGNPITSDDEDSDIPVVG